MDLYIGKTSQKYKHMILTEIRTEAEYEFLKIWNSCEWMIWNKYPGSIFMIRGEEVLFEQDWQQGVLWCNYIPVWRFLQLEFKLNVFEIKEMILDISEEKLKCGEFWPIFFYSWDKYIKILKTSPSKNVMGAHFGFGKFSTNELNRAIVSMVHNLETPSDHGLLETIKIKQYIEILENFFEKKKINE